jgi:cystathionine beta-lyase
MESNRRFLATLLSKELPDVGYRIPDFSYLAWLDLKELKLGENPAEVLLERGKLAVNPGITFGAESSNFVRLNFATSEEILTEAISRMVSCVKK